MFITIPHSNRMISVIQVELRKHFCASHTVPEFIQEW